MKNMMNQSTQRNLRSIAATYDDASIHFHANGKATLTFHQVYKTEPKRVIINSFLWSIPGALIHSFERIHKKDHDQVKIRFAV